MKDALEEIRDLAAQFAAERLRPGVESRDRERAFDDGLLAELGELGFSGILVPETLGGLGLGAPTLVAVTEALAWAEPALALLLGGEAALAEALRDTAATEVLAELAVGRARVWVQLSHEGRHEPAVVAVRDGSGWRLEGTVSWVMASAPDGILPLVAETEPGPGLFLVPAESRGFQVTERLDTLGLRSARIGTVRLDGVRVPATALAADTGVGAALVRWETYERLVAAATACGIARAALEYARDYADSREQFGRRLRQFEGVRVLLANMAGRAAAARALAETAAAAPDPAAAAQAKVVASEAAMRVTTDAVQIFGGYGYMRDYPVEKLMREAKTTELLMGTNDGLRTLVVNAMYTN